MNCATEKCLDMILLTQCYYYRGPLVFATSIYDPPGMLRRYRCVKIFSLKTYSTTHHVQQQRQSVVRHAASSSEWSAKASKVKQMECTSPEARDSAAAGHTWAFCYLRTPLQSEISFLADTLWSLPENHKMFDGSSLACIIFGFLVDFPCARFENTWSATRVS